MYLGRLYTRDIEFNSRLLTGGVEVADVQSDLRDNVLWIEDIQEIPGINRESILDAFVELKKNIGLDAVVIYDEKEIFSEVLGTKGFKRTGELIINSDAEVLEIGEEPLMKVAVNQFSRARPSEAILFNFLKERLLGIRSEIEANSLGITNTQLRNYFQYPEYLPYYLDVER